jgi:hypothetical protein
VQAAFCRARNLLEAGAANAAPAKRLNRMTEFFIMRE